MNSSTPHAMVVYDESVMSEFGGRYMHITLAASAQDQCHINSNT